MDILSGERSGHQYLQGPKPAAAADQKLEDSKTNHTKADEDLFPIQVEDTCMVALTTAYNARESEGGTTKQELLHFVEECFELPADKLKQLKKRALTSDKPELQLKCKVLRAAGLTAKDANGLSDPYCRLGVLNEVHKEKNTVKQKELQHWKKEKLVGSVVGTKVKQATLEPEWNEEFYLSVTEPNNELLVLEVWDSDEPAEKAAGNKIKGLKGLGTYIAEKTIQRGDDFMGRLFYPLRSIPNSGEEKTFVLYSHSGKTQHGYITLQLSIGAKQKRISLETHLSEYTALTRALVNFSTRKEGVYVRKWNGELPQMAQKFLEHYTVLNGVDSLQQTCVYLSVLVKYHKLYTVNMKAICDLIRKLKEYHREFSSTNPLQQWKEQVFTDLNELSEGIQGVLMNHLSMFSIGSASGVEKIEQHVKTLCVVYSFRPFTEQLPSKSASLKETLEKCISVAVVNWFRVLNAHLLPKVDTEEEQLAAFVTLSEHCLDQCQRTFKCLNPIFLEAGVDYFSYFFISLDKLLCAEADAHLEIHVESSETSTFAIYRSFKGMFEMMKYVNKSMSGSLSIRNFHKWFRHGVQSWIRMAINKCKDYTAKAIAADSEITVTNDVLFSNSALDTTGFLLQVGSFWKHLEWPIASVAYGYAIAVVQGISECALFYVGEVFKKLSHHDMFDEKGQFRATEKVCIILNNMQHIRQELSQFEEKLELQSFCDWLEAEEKLGGPFRELVKNVLESADEDIFNRMNGVMLEITDKLSPDIQRFVHNVIAQDRAMSNEEATDPLLEYLQRNLQTFVSHLYPAVLKIILHHVWRVSVDSVEKCLGEIPVKKGTDSAQLHQRLFTTLQIMREFYHCGGDGLNDKDLDTEEYKILFAKLDVLRLPTDKLILRFFSDLAQRQREEMESGKAEMGTLLVSVGYLRQSSIIEIDVIQGRNLPGLDKTGLSDPFVQLTLMPTWAFSAKTPSKHMKTSVQKQTVDPFFNETFKLPARETEVDVDGAVLLLSVFDHDFVGSNDFAGMCVVACKDISRILSPKASLSDPNAPQRVNLTLPLFHYSTSGVTPVFAELDNRAHLGDAKATEFFKSDKSSNLLGPSLHQSRRHGRISVHNVFDSVNLQSMNLHRKR